MDIYHQCTARLVVVDAWIVAHAADRRQLDKRVVITAFHHFAVQVSNPQIVSSARMHASVNRINAAAEKLTKN